MTVIKKKRKKRTYKGRKLKTHCKYGHEFTSDNFIIIQGNRRRCLTCRPLRELKTYCVHGHELTEDNIYRSKTGKRYCAICRKHRASKDYQPPCKSPEAKRRRVLKSLYGITPEDFDKMVEEQKGVCKICGNVETFKNGKLHVDHNHETGKVRGLLCNNCNRGMGLLKDSIDILKSAITYLELQK